MRGAILAGGAASRFGAKPKGLEKVGGERILDRVVRNVQAATGNRPLLIANHEEASEWIDGLEVTGDIYRECGSLGGVYTAVAHHESPVLVVAWDMPFLTVDFLAEIIRRSPDTDVCIPESNGPLGVEPMCAVYGPACREPIKAQLDDEDYRATGFHDAVRVELLPLAEAERFGDVEKLFFNINTPRDLERAEELWRNERE